MPALADPARFDPSAIAALGRLDLKAKIIADGLLQGIHPSRKKGFSSEFADFKAYTPGDDLRHLDWKVYARSERLFVKQAESETNIEVALLLDASPSMAWRWQATVSKLEYAVNLLATLAYLHLRQQDQVGLLVHDARELHALPPRSRRRHLDEIFATLGKIEPAGTETVSHLARGVDTLIRRKGHVVLCSDLLEDEEASGAALKLLGAREDEVILFHLLDEAEVTLPFDRATHLRDSETGELMPVDIAALRKDHAETVAGLREHWAGVCRGLGIHYIPLTTATNYVEALRLLLDVRAV